MTEQLSLDKDLLLNRKYMSQIIENPVEKAIYKASYRYPSEVVNLNNPMSINYYLHYFKNRMEGRTETCKEWDVSLIGSNLFIGQFKGVSKIGNKREIKVGRETRPIDGDFYSVFGINTFLVFIGIIYSIFSLIPNITYNFDNDWINFFQSSIGYFILWATIASGISSIGMLTYKIIWNKNRFFVEKRKIWKVILSIIALDGIFLCIGATIYFRMEIFGVRYFMYLDLLPYIIIIIILLALSSVIFFLLRSYHRDKPDLIARNLSSVWIRYQFLVIPEDGFDFSKLSLGSMLEYKPKKLLAQVLICWDFKSISQAFADVEQAKSELAKLIKEVEIVFGGNIAM
ncbi:MAG: hypothetical protein H7647_05730 [Candidatus Heimdallarchaeota archaeon]|nr:hypothetical protein [Candidatus Heimdallarchaeota archaeon]MCK4253925.1 hypothetical protein [Candidatus Heimdallarchaeota archaeon]